MEACEVVGWQAIVSGGDAAELLELADGPLDAVAVLVDGGIEVARSRHAGALRDDRSGADRLGMVEDGVTVISLVGDDVAGSEAVEQGQRIGGIAGLAAGQQEADWSAETVDRQMPLAGQASSGAPQSLIATAPF